MTALSKKPSSLAVNRKAFRDYLIIERFEAGIGLLGTEVKSCKNGRINLAGGFARVENGEVILYNLNIPLYEYGNKFNHEPLRPRRLLFNRREINRLQGQIDQKGYTLIPIRVYLKRSMVKVELALCRGKRMSDKREILRRKTAEMETAKALSNPLKRERIF